MEKRSTHDPATTRLLRIVSLFGLGFLLNTVLLVLVSLKEDPIFWRDEGGYPIWLREFVLETFYPLLFSGFIVLVFTSIYQFSILPSKKAARIVGLSLVLLLWVFFGIVLTILVWNNVNNLLEGRDLHYHPPL